MDFVGAQEHLCKQQRRDQRTHAKEKVQAIHEWSSLLSVCPKQKGIATNVDDACRKSAQEHGKQEDTQRGGNWNQHG